MKRYELTYIVTAVKRTRHDVNAWIRSMNKQGIPVTFDNMMRDGGVVVVGQEGTLTAMLVETDEANPDIIESVNATKQAKR